jgi:PleD family two-component response regulator
MVHPDDTDSVMAEAEKHFRGDAPRYEVVHRMLHKDGSVRWFLARGTAIRDENGKPVRVLGTDTDITKRILAEKALKNLPASEKKIEEEKMKPEPLSKGSGTVLLIDDEEMILDVGKDMLELLGYQVYISRKGVEAISIFEKHKSNIDLILLNMVMPGMDGGEVYDRLK